ncbi:hypothetical protein CIPAW_09G118500 [Carya illinoinensis]|uniref:Uncharacterized protein n=1 Tax=Carya illinoinensis TaxID=32201 RepID=A0A8T1PD25_CARIL|nr:hypothetical protein CIPAW_09G118500 [Carya illinoinensis]
MMVSTPPSSPTNTLTPIKNAKLSPLSQICLNRDSVARGKRPGQSTYDGGAFYMP